MFHQRLQVRLENDEPKCANCKWWAPFGEYYSTGVCKGGAAAAASGR